MHITHDRYIPRSQPERYASQVLAGLFLVLAAALLLTGIGTLSTLPIALSLLSWRAAVVLRRHT
ncbi:hypothetical protein PSEUDO8Z_60682 [Pseudomonas sp. 8Z]|nr:hypothetical protein PSEUDO8Z_60682 [Pseudomonas sp. 8Z]